MQNSRHARPNPIEFGWLTLLVIVPICFSPLAIDPFEVPKAIVVCILTLVLLSIIVIDYFKRWHFRLQVSGRSSWRQVFEYFMIEPLIVGFVSIYCLASMLSIDSRISFWSRLQPSSGLAVTLCYVSIFLMIMKHGRGPWQQRRIAVVMVATSMPVVMYGLVQAVNMDLFHWKTDSISNVLSTLGRSNFLGTYLVMIIPITAYLSFSTKHRAAKLICSVLLVLQILCLLLTEARAAWLAVGIALIVSLWISARHVVPRHTRKSVLMGGALTLVLILVVGAVLEIATENTERFVSIADRAYLWTNSLRMITDRLVLGYGPGTFYEVFPAYYPEILRTPGHAPYFLNPHNLVLELAVSIGLIGLLVYLLFAVRMYYLAQFCIRRSVDHDRRLLLGASLASIIGYHISSLFTPSTVTTTLLFWVLAALIFGSAKYHL